MSDVDILVLRGQNKQTETIRSHVDRLSDLLGYSVFLVDINYLFTYLPIVNFCKHQKVT